jgi:DNA-binding CsgD family transcriptional regulator
VVESAVIGRNTELEALARFLLDGEKSALLLLEGEPGVGKSTLWEHGVSVAAEGSFRVLQSRSSEAETGLSFATVTDLLDEALDEVLPALVPPRARALETALLRDEGAADSRAIALGVVDALSVLSSESSVLVAIDDWQWLDPSSSMALTFAARRLVGSRVRFMCTARVGRGGAAGCSLPRELPERAVRRILVQPFSLSDLHQLVQHRYGLTPSRPALLRLHRETGGNPYVALQVVRAVIEEGGDLSSPEPLPVPSDIEPLLRRRVTGAADDVREVLAFAALLGDPTVSAIEAASSDGGGGRRHLMAATREELLIVDADRVRFTHPLLASAVRSTLGAAHSRRLHRRLAEVSDDLEPRALHLALATDEPDDSVAQLLDEAGQAAARRGAHARAAELFDHATRLTSAGDLDEVVRRVLAASEQHYVGGDGRVATAQLKDLIARLPRGPLRAAALEALADVEVSDSLIEYYEQALDEVGADPARRASIHIGMATCLGTRGEFDGWMANLREGVRLARLAGDHGLASFGMAELGLVCFANGEGPQRELYEEACRHEAAADALRPSALSPEWTFGRQLGHAGQLEEGRTLLEHALKRSREAQSAEFEMGALMLLAELELNAGRWGQADRRSREALEIAEQIQISNGETKALFFRSLVESHIGLLDQATLHASRGADLGREIGDLHHTMANESVLGFIALTTDDLSTARRLLSPHPDRIRRLGPRDPQHFPKRALAAEVLVLIGALDQGEQEIDELEEVAALSNHSWGQGLAARCRAQLFSARGETEQALGASSRAVELHEAVGLPFERARSLLIHGVMQRRAKLKRPARETFERAATIFEELGSQLWAERTRSELSRIGGRRAASEGALTATEQSVAELAATGRTNKQIARDLHISVRTVEANLTKVYRKLGLNSRTELAARLPPELAPTDG